MKDKIFSLIMESDVFNGTDAAADAKVLAEYLAEKGVLVPPCNFGDSIYWIDESPLKNGDMPVIREEKNIIDGILFTKDGRVFVPSEPIHGNPIGFDEVNSNEYSYISRELAEAELSRIIESKKKTICWTLYTGISGQKYTGEFDVFGDTPENVIEQQAKEEAFNYISWNWCEKKNKED